MKVMRIKEILINSRGRGLTSNEIDMIKQRGNELREEGHVFDLLDHSSDLMTVGFELLLDHEDDKGEVVLSTVNHMVDCLNDRCRTVESDFGEKRFRFMVDTPDKEIHKPPLT